MDNVTIIGAASIITAGITMGIGSVGPALGEGRAVSSALSSMAQQPDAASTITRTLFVGLAMIESMAIYCFVVSMILIFANPFWELCYFKSNRKLAMLFDWFTLVAQLVNFLILAWLLKRFLYKPILNTIDQREKHIAAQISDAESRKTEALKELENLRVQNEQLEQQRQELMNKAIADAIQNIFACWKNREKKPNRCAYGYKKR